MKPETSIEPCRQTILVIEDDTGVRETIANLLEFNGYQVETSATGTSGMELVQKLLPDLIICDIMMGDTDGYTVLRKLQSDPKTGQIPFIFLTARAELDDMRRGMRLGADDYITKPFNNDDLLESIALRFRKATKTNENQPIIPDNIAQRIVLLTTREKEIIRLFCEGLNCKAISERLFLSFHTVDSHRKNIARKLGVGNISGIVGFAYQYKLI